MTSLTVKILKDEDGNNFVPYTSTIALYDPDGETISDKIAKKLETSSLIAGTGITLIPDITNHTVEIQSNTPGANLINNLTTSVAGQGALDAYQGYVLNTTKVNISDIVDNCSSLDNNKPLSAYQGYILYNTKVDKDSIARVNNVVSRNLLNLYNFQSQTINGVTFTKNKDNGITINGTATQAFGVDFVRFKLKAGTYHLALNETVTNDFYIYDYDTNTGIISNNSTTTLTRDYNNVGFDTWINSGTIFNNVTIYPQLEEGSTATPYTPYLNMQELEKNSIINNYSTGEQVIGKWIDGKPLYRKVIQPVIEIGANAIVPHGISNLSQVLKVDATFFWSNKTYPFPAIYEDLSKQVAINYIDSTNVYIKSFGENWSTQITTIILEYTKTTD